MTIKELREIVNKKNTKIQEAKTFLELDFKKQFPNGIFQADYFYGKKEFLNCKFDDEEYDILHQFRLFPNGKNWDFKTLSSNYKFGDKIVNTKLGNNKNISERKIVEKLSKHYLKLKKLIKKDYNE